MDIAWVAAVAAVASGLISVSGQYLVSKRGHSSSAARLRADLDILEKARELDLPPAQVRAIETRLQRSIQRHTRHWLGKAEGLDGASSPSAERRTDAEHG